MSEKRIFTGAYGPGIGLLDISPNGDMSWRLIAEQAGASYLAFDGERGLLYALSRSEGDNPGLLRVYHWDGASLELLAARQQAAVGACHLAISRDWLVLAYYRSGKAEVFALDQDGLPEENSAAVIKHEGSGPRPQQDQAHIHWAYIRESEPSRLVFYLIDLGCDTLSEYVLERASAKSDAVVSLKRVFDFPAGSGPRHAFAAPDRGRIYVLTELSSELFVLEDDGKAFSFKERFDLRDELKDGDSWGGAIKASYDGKLLFCSNRGDETIRAFDISEPQTKPWELAHSRFHHCRDLLYTAVDGREFLLLAQLHSDTVSCMSVNRADRTLTELSSSLDVVGASCLIEAE